jgi:polysaccharide biosynthesis/export protein
MDQSRKARSTDSRRQMNKFARLWSFVFFTLAASQLMSNCGMDAAQNKPVAMTESGNGHPASQPVVAGGSSFAGAEPTEYRISPDDILQISVFQVNDLNNAVQVNQDGTVTLPLIGKCQVAGKTTSEAEQIIAGKLRQKYLQSPQVSVSVKTYGKRITVSGEVKSPLVLGDDGSTTLSQGIARAGGISELANSQRVHIARSKDQHVQDDIYSLDDIQAGKVSDPLLHGGDIVVVEQSGVKVALKSVSSLLPFAIIASIF